MVGDDLIAMDEATIDIHPILQSQWFGWGWSGGAKNHGSNSHGIDQNDS